MDSFNDTSHQYISNSLLSLTDASPNGILAVFVVFFDFNSTLSVKDIENALQQYFNRWSILLIIASRRQDGYRPLTHKHKFTRRFDAFNVCCNHGFTLSACIVQWNYSNGNCYFFIFSGQTVKLEHQGSTYLVPWTTPAVGKLQVEQVFCFQYQYHPLVRSWSS